MGGETYTGVEAGSESASDKVYEVFERMDAHARNQVEASSSVFCRRLVRRLAHCVLRGRTSGRWNEIHHSSVPN